MEIRDVPALDPTESGSLAPAPHHARGGTLGGNMPKPVVAYDEGMSRAMCRYEGVRRT